MNATATRPDIAEISETGSLSHWAALKIIESWAKAVDRFRQWERREIIEKEPSPEDLERHRREGAWFIRWTRFLQSMVMDPEFPVRECVPEVEGRLIQLEQAWDTIHDPMPEAEAAAILKKAFPDAPRTGEPR
jgi:hypothetical protein